MKNTELTVKIKDPQDCCSWSRATVDEFEQITLDTSEDSEPKMFLTRTRAELMLKALKQLLEISQ